MPAEVSLMPSPKKIHKIPLSCPHPHLPFSPQPTTVPLLISAQCKIRWSPRGFHWIWHPLVRLERTVSVKWWARGGVWYSQWETKITELRIGREDPVKKELLQKRKLLHIIFTCFQRSPRINLAWSPTQVSGLFPLHFSLGKSSALSPDTAQSQNSTCHVFHSSLGLERPPLIFAPAEEGTVLAGCQCLGTYHLCSPEVNDPLVSGILPFPLDPFYLACSNCLKRVRLQIAKAVLASGEAGLLAYYFKLSAQTCWQPETWMAASPCSLESMRLSLVPSYSTVPIYSQFHLFSFIFKSSIAIGPPT